jgi:hypothetical protein
MHLRSGKNLDTKPEPEPQPDAGHSEEQYTELIGDDFNILMNVLHARIMEISKLKDGQPLTKSRVFETIVLNQIRVLTEIYYLMNHYSDLIFTYINKINAEYASEIVLAALERINFIYNQLMNFKFIKKSEFKRTLDPLYHEWEEFIIKYGYLYKEK